MISRNRNSSEQATANGATMGEETTVQATESIQEQVSVNTVVEDPKESAEVPRAAPVVASLVADEPSSKELPQYVHDVVSKIAPQEGFTPGMFKIAFEVGSGKGDGFVGELFRARITEGTRELVVLCKIPPINDIRRQQFGSMIIFEREVLAYSEFLPVMYEFQREKGVTDELGIGFFNTPKCYHAFYDGPKDQSAILMEDLRLSGYRMWNKMVPVNYEHAKLLMVQLGRLHAVSFALKDQRPKAFAPFKLASDPMQSMMAGEAGTAFVGMMQMTLDRSIGLLRPDEEKYRQKLLKLRDVIFDDLGVLTSPKLSEPYTILGHGDCWVNNMMYEYKNGVPTKIVLLDWQLCRYVSPALDLLYFFFSCTDGEFRRRHYDEMIRIYYGALKELLEKLGGDATRQFPYTALLRQLKLHGKFALYMAMFIVPMLCVENQDLPDLDAQAEKYNETKEIEMPFELINKSEEKYQKRMGDVLRDIFRFGYL